MIVDVVVVAGGVMALVVSVMLVVSCGVLLVVFKAIDVCW